MDTHTAQRKADHIEQAVTHVGERWEPGEIPLLETFVRAFYRGVPSADVLHESPEALYGAAIAAWRFGEVRTPGRPCVRIYRPTLEEYGWASPHTVVEIVNDDMPFLVDSVAGELQRMDADVMLIVHPVLDVVRDGHGRAVALGGDGEAQGTCRRESWIQIQVRAQPEERHAALQEGVEAVLGDVRVAVEDWKPIVGCCRALGKELRQHVTRLDAEACEESAAFLEWLTEDNFTFLGYREYTFEGRGEEATGHVVTGSGLGLLRHEDERVFEGMLGGGRLPPDVRQFLREPQPLRITKANRRSTVHRPVLLDTVAVKRFDEAGHVVGGRLIVGLFSSRAYGSNPLDVPILRRMVQATMSRAGIPAESHDGRSLLHILVSYPRDELFQISQEELAATALGILGLQERPRTALFARVDPFERFVSCLVYVPRDRYDTGLRMRIQDILTSAWNGSLIAFYTRLADSPLARVHFYIATDPATIPDVDVQAVEQALAQAGRSWTDRLEEALVEEHGEQEGVRLLRAYGEAFPASYRDAVFEKEAVADIQRIEAALSGDGLALNLHRSLEAPTHQLGFRVYTWGDPVPLSDVLPMLENMGFQVVGEVPWRLKPAGTDTPAWIRELLLYTRDRSTLDLTEVRDRFHDAFRQVWRGELESDGFNRLVMLAGLDAREVTVLRAYCRFLRQARTPFSQTYMEQTLASQPEVARKLVELFETRFDPERRVGAEDRAKEIVADVTRLLDRVTNLDMDRIIRRFLEVIEATLRTNFYQRDADGRPKPYVSFKLDSQRIQYLPRPRPHREIFVYSPRVEAVHLRGGKVARGGIRWSDRLEDFRTEVLGLMKAQMVKNTVIVPVGSKGGFVIKRPPAAEAGREALMAEVVAGYQTLMCGLLDLTDNLNGGSVTPPQDVVRRDGDDPYLVVAADKGTATFSDIANGVAAEYGFWLDDAFASGGSAGYDHKKIAITARGAWECVKRHFREMGQDIQSEDFDVVGVGDMSGDVFGNGMLLSPHIRLVGAFDHRHVFVDPAPDPAESFRERRRVFDLPRSTWADYDTSKISAGGGVWDRTRKSIPVSPEIRALFSIDGEEVTPNDLIHAMLQAEVGLLWFGGIGTFVKATAETHADVGDRANEAVRIDARQIRAKVIGEGANLALTQRARVEAALRGVRLNTDALDNSAGVDCSDHEVNIKILLGDVERSGELTRTRRNRLLEEMTEEVASLVLRDNYLQSQAITVAQELGAPLLDRLGRFMRALEKEGRLDRALEFLPDDEALVERFKARIGLTRPELAVLLSYAKLVLYDELLESSLPDDPWLLEELRRYFPVPLQRDYDAAMRQHRLRREIVATVVTNSVLNRVGIAFVHEVREKTGLPAAEVARAYLAVRDVLGMDDLWASIEALDNRAPAAVQAAMLAGCSRLIEQVVVWILREEEKPVDVPTLVSKYREGVHSLAADLDRLLPEGHRADIERQAQSLVRRGAPETLARTIACLDALEPACEIVRLAGAAGVGVARAGEVYYAVGDAFGFDWLHNAAVELPADTAWEKLAVSALVDDLYAHQGALAASILAAAVDGEPAARSIERWSGSRGPLVARTRQLLAELAAATRPDLAMLAVAGRQLQAMAG